MAKYRFTNKAVEDLSDIWEYTVNTWSERQADVYYEMLIDCCQKITISPRIYGTKLLVSAKTFTTMLASRFMLSLSP